jgi:hypothetical protein
MAVTAQQVYDQVAFDLAEDPPTGLRLGIVTLPQFFDVLNLAVLDFLKQSGIIQRIWTTTVLSGQSVYLIPDDIVDIHSVFLGGKWLPQSTQQDLNNQIRKWRNMQAIPRYYYQDGLGLKSIGLAPSPNYNGEWIIGPNDPNPPAAVYDSFSALCQVDATQVVLNPVQHRGLTIIGTRKATTQVTQLSDPIPLIPDDIALQTLPFMVLSRLFSGDNELKDSQRAAFCAAQEQETMSVCKEVSGLPDRQAP